MSQPDISAGMKAKQQERQLSSVPDPGHAQESIVNEATHNVTVRLPISLDDSLEEFLFHVNRAARTVGQRTLTKRKLIERAIRELVAKSPADVLGQAG